MTYYANFTSTKSTATLTEAAAAGIAADLDSTVDFACYLADRRGANKVSVMTDNEGVTVTVSLFKQFGGVNKKVTAA